MSQINKNKGCCDHSHHDENDSHKMNSSHNHCGHDHDNDSISFEEGRGIKVKFDFILAASLFILSFFVSDDIKIYGFKFKILILLISYIAISYKIIFKTFKNIGKINFMDENFLMTVATFGALYLKDYREAVGVMIFFQIGELFEELSVFKSINSIQNLLDIREDNANLKKNDGSIVVIKSEDLKIGDTILVKAGEKVPVDSKVSKGESFLNLIALTGESLPVEVKIGDPVLSGSVNGETNLEMIVEKTYHNSAVSKIIEMVDNARHKKAETEKFITKFARYYTPVVIFTAIIISTVVPFIFGDFNTWFSRALIFIVISCPCALVISVPLCFFSSIGFAAKKGILIKGSAFLEKMNDLDAIVFDKTGTITEASFKISSVNNINISKEEFLELFKAAESASNHPIAIALFNEIDSSFEENQVEAYKTINGLGIELKYKNDDILVGNAELMKKNKITFEDNNEVSTALHLAKNKIYLGYITIEDIVRDEVKELVPKLKNKGIDSYIFTGDKKEVAIKVANIVGINKENVFSDLLPNQKVEKMELVKDKYKITAFLGDGINDAPVLSMADVGIAMGKLGSDIAIESADIILMDDKPSKIIELLSLAKWNRKKIITNITFALFVKLLVMILGILGLANMWMAIFSDVGVTVICILYSFLAFKKED